ncbi:MAG: S8 family serine peptidase, partial [Thermoanaerobaculia bacterium]
MLGLFLVYLASRVEAPVDPRIFADRLPDERASFLVVLGNQADLSGAAAIPDRIERRRFVYETLRARAEASQASLRERLARAGVPFRPHFLVNMLEVEGDAPLARELAGREDVAAVAANLPAAIDRIPEATDLRSGARGGVEPNLVLIGAPEIWARGVTGQGIVVGVADTGFQWDHPALKNAYRGWDGTASAHEYNWHDAIHDAAPGNPCGSDSPAPCDDHGHGTGVAGFAVGRDGDTQIGVAPGARLIGCRNMEAGKGTPARYTECFEWLLAPTDAHGENARPDLGADIINNSWTCPPEEGCTDPTILNGVVAAVRVAGIAMAFAAGNGGASCSTLARAPAIADAAFSIGATFLDDRIALFSSCGPVTSDGSQRLKPDMTAPGVSLHTAGLNGSYVPFSGTSAAAPHVAGAFALLWSAYPRLAGDVDAAEGFLTAGARPLRAEFSCGLYPLAAVPNPVFGWGRLNIVAAFALAAAEVRPSRVDAARPPT